MVFRDDKDYLLFIQLHHVLIRINGVLSNRPVVFLDHLDDFVCLTAIQAVGQVICIDPVLPEVLAFLYYLSVLHSPEDHLFGHHLFVTEDDLLDLLQVGLVGLENGVDFFFPEF